MAQILNTNNYPFYNQQVTYGFSPLITRTSWGNIQPAVAVNQEFMARHAINNVLNTPILSITWEYFDEVGLGWTWNPTIRLVTARMGSVWDRGIMNTRREVT